MRKPFILLLLLAVTFLSMLPCGAADVDPILVYAPNEKVIGCKNDIFLELTQNPTLSKVASGRTAKNYFIYFTAEILFLPETSWNGIDKNSFILTRTDAEGNVETYTLNYAVTMMANLKNGWHIFGDTYHFTDLRKTYLIFDVVPYAYDGWTFIFQPTERGAEKPYCKVEIPLKVQ